MNEGRRESAGPAGPDRWSRVDSVVRQALTLAPPDRAAFVERACRGDPALRHDVTSLLEHEAAAESFLAAPAVADAGSAMLGRQLGPYRIDAWLGAGGMGEVYRARDTVLDRDVAVKVLLPATLDPDGLARLKREARTLAALNHPHIAAIYGIEESDASTGPSDAGIRALILELLDGETLAERIARGPLPCRDALHHAAQIADALAAAHDKGIVHRDLKPGNIQVTASGSVKVFDFGIAKTPAGAAAGSTVVTREGSVIGTAAYMSPEQVRAEPIDRQTDVWAFGCVLFEMLAGKPAFDGATTSDTIAAVLEHEPSWSALPAATPDGVRSLLRRCLRKDKAGRQRELSDARLELEEAATAAAAARWRPTIAQRATAAVVLIGVSAGALGIDWIDSASVAPIDPLARKHTIVVPPAARLALGIAAQEAGQPNIAVSEDGSHVVYVAVKGGVPQLYLQSSEAFAPTALAGTDGAYAPFFSPDGKWIAFFAGTKLKKVFIRGGEPHIVCDSRRSRGGTWADDGTIYFAAHEGSALLRVSSEGGAAPTPVASGRRQFMWPSALPGGRALLFTSFVARQPHVEVIDVTTGVRKVLLHRATSARYARTGHIVYMQDGRMQAVPFDVTLMALIGPSVPIIPGVRSESMGSAQFAFSGEGTLAYVEGPWAAKGQLAWVDTSGNIDRLPLEAQAYGQLGLAADDRHIAAEITTATTDIFIFDLTRGTRRRLTTEGNNICPVWAPDSKRVAYASDRGGALNLFWESIQGGAAERLCTTTQDQFPLSWSPDGTALAFIEFTHAMNYDLKVVNVDQSCDARPLVATPFDEGTADFSPDGRWIAYTSDESGRMEVYVRRYPPTDEKWDISSEGGADVVWSPTGKDVFYGNGLKRLAAPVEIAPVFAPGKPRLFAEGPFMRHTGHSFDVDRMGRRLLVVTELEQPAHNEIRVVSNWFEELRRKAPSR